MNDVLINILSVVVTAVILPLISFAGTKLIAYLNAKVKDENAKLHLTSATTIVTNAVLTVFQTYVDSLKNLTLSQDITKTSLVILTYIVSHIKI